MLLHQAGFVPDFGTFHHLDAVGTFFHDAAGANGYIGIALKARGLFRCFGVIKKIEAPSLVRAVGGAVPGTPAPGVHHGVQAFRSMHGGIDGAYGFAWGLAALLAGHGDGGERPFLREVPVDAYPVQGAAPGHLVTPHYGNVIFRAASNHAGVAADATGRVNGHFPLVNGIRAGRGRRDAGRTGMQGERGRLHNGALNGFRPLPEGSQGNLFRGNAVCFRFFHLSAEFISAGIFLPFRYVVDPAITQRKNNEIIRHSRNGAQDDFHLRGGGGKRAVHGPGIRTSQPQKGGGGNLCGRRPADACYWVRAFLHPCIAFPASVPNGIVRAELQFQHPGSQFFPVAAKRRCGRLHHGCSKSRFFLRGQGSIGRFFRIAALKRLSPGRSFIFRIHGAFKAFARSVVNGREVGGGIVRRGEMAFGGKQAGKHFFRRNAPVQGKNDGLAIAKSAPVIPLHPP